jgi:phosphohistidine phosphatase
MRDAPFMAKMFVEKSGGVDLIVSSPANRALTTARFFAEAIGFSSNDIKTDQRIYLASTQDLLAVLNSIDSRYDKVIIFGHNPGFTYLVQYLTGEYVNMPTCAIARVDFEVDSWEAVGADNGSLIAFDYPKNHDVT